MIPLQIPSRSPRTSGHSRIFSPLLLVCLFASPLASQRAVLLYVIDGLHPTAAKTAIRAGAVHVRLFSDSGTVVEEAYCTSPEPRVVLPDGTEPWGSAAPPNIAMHTGTHIFDSKEIDDVFRAARRRGIRSVFAGSADNYRTINTADFPFVAHLNDSAVIAYSADKIRNERVRLVSIHVQQLRRAWGGPEDMMRTDSPYIAAILRADSLLGLIISAFTSAGVWDSTFVIVASDHGMGQTAQSDHPSPERSSWHMYLNVFGPGIRKNATIPYAEAPDIAVLIARLLRLEPLRGHLRNPDGEVSYATSGTLLSNVFEDGPAMIDHPMLIRRYLESHSWKAPASYGAYREAMIDLLRTAGR